MCADAGVPISQTPYIAGPAIWPRVRGRIQVRRIQQVIRYSLSPAAFFPCSNLLDAGDGPFDDLVKPAATTRDRWGIFRPSTLAVVRLSSVRRISNVATSRAKVRAAP